MIGGEGVVTKVAVSEGAAGSYPFWETEWRVSYLVLRGLGASSSWEAPALHAGGRGSIR